MWLHKILRTPKNNSPMCWFHQKTKFEIINVKIYFDGTAGKLRWNVHDQQFPWKFELQLFRLMFFFVFI